MNETKFYFCETCVHCDLYENENTTISNTYYCRKNGEVVRLYTDSCDLYQEN